MTERLAPPAKPCGSCPYVKGTPAGIWAAEEYEKLPAYDADTPHQPTAIFYCHQRTGCICGGWLLTHDRNHLLSLRLAPVFGVDLDDSVWTYNPEGVEVFASGKEACDYGLSGVDAPSEEAQRKMRGLIRLAGIQRRKGK